MVREIWQTIWGVGLQFWAVLAEMTPYLLFGFAVAGVLSVLVSPRWVERHLGGRGLWQILKATLFGIPLPLCSCGVIPVSASLRRHGASKAATTGFLLSTPQTGVDSIFVTYSLLGPVFTIFRPLMALVNGLLGGLAVHWLDHGDEPVPEAVEQVEVEQARQAREREARAGEASDCQDACCATESRPRGRFWRIVHYGFVTLPADIGKALLVGLLLAGVIGVVVPDDFFARYEWLQSGLGGMLLMMAVGIPLYVCATASVPLAAALIVKGISPGAALVFLMTGPATNAATIAMIWRVMGRRTALVYLASVAVTALASGFVLDGIFAGLGHGPAIAETLLHEHGMMGIPWWQHLSGVVLVAVLAWSMLSPRLTGARRQNTWSAAMGEESAILDVTGMTCSHCAANVKRALEEVPGVQTAQVDLQAGRAIVAGTDLQAERLCKVVRDLGYGAEPAGA